MAIKVRDGQRVLFIGDSITDCGRRAECAPLGNGYVKLVHDMILLREPAKDVEVINKGIGGDTVVGLRNRWHDDVLGLEPDWLSIKIGINDLHGYVMGGADAVTPELYAEAYHHILARTRKKLPKCNLLLIDPFYISTEKASMSFRSTVLKAMPAYINTVHDLSRKYKTRLVKTHDMFQGLLKHNDPDTFCPEPVHPHLTGHLAIAEAVYEALSR